MKDMRMIIIFKYGREIGIKNKKGKGATNKKMLFRFKKTEKIIEHAMHNNFLIPNV